MINKTRLLTRALKVIVYQHELIEQLIEENVRLKQLCKQHARAVDFYIKKLDEAEKLGYRILYAAIMGDLSLLK